MAAPRVLIDGFNLALKHGTGIKTYTMLLDQALRSRGADASFLFGYDLPPQEDPLLGEVQFHNDPVERPKTRLYLIRRKALTWGKAALNSAPPIKRVPSNAVVVTGPSNGPRPLERALNGKCLYAAAWQRSVYFGKFLDARAPETFDALHMTYPIPLRVKGAGRKIVTIHDLIPLRLPYTTTDDKAELLRRHRIWAAEADLIFTVSEFSKADIVELLDVDPERVAVTHQPSRFAPLADDEAEEQVKTLWRYDLEPQGYMLFVGAIEPKKNLGRLLKAYADADVDKPMVVIGPRGWMWQDEIGWLLDNERPELKRKIRFLDHVPVEDLRFILSGALAAAMPSLYEGYGLPLVEAMGFGVPLLASRSSSLPEVAEDAAVYVDPFDVRDLRDAIERLVGDAALRQQLSAHGLARSQRLTMDNFTGQVADGYRKLGLLD
jgi:glycosyltransferase involved in cell wall biosynthesis